MLGNGLMKMVKLAVKGVYNLSGQGALMVGTVLGGVLKRGMSAKMGEYVIQASSLEADKKLLSEAHEGQTVGIAIVKLSGPADPPKSFFNFFSKGRYLDVLRSQKGLTLEFEEAA